MISTKRATRSEVRKLVDARNFPALCELERSKGGVFRYLRTLALDRDEPIYWKAVEAAGHVSGCLGKDLPEEVRNVVRRLLWSLSDESGDMAWGAIEMLAEIYLANPDTCRDIPPILIHMDELIFRKSAVWAAGRIACGKHPESVREVTEELVAETGNADPEIRAYAAWALGCIGGPSAREAVTGLLSDSSGPVKFYSEGELKFMSVGEAAAASLSMLK